MQSELNVTPRVLWTLFDKAWENEDVNTMLSLIFLVEEYFSNRSIGADDISVLE